MSTNFSQRAFKESGPVVNPSLNNSGHPNSYQSDDEEAVNKQTDKDTTPPDVCDSHNNKLIFVKVHLKVDRFVL